MNKTCDICYEWYLLSEQTFMFTVILIFVINDFVFTLLDDGE